MNEATVRTTQEFDNSTADSDDEEIVAQTWVCDRCWENVSDPDATVCACGNHRPLPGWSTLPLLFRERYKLVRRLRSTGSGVLFLATEEVGDDGGGEKSPDAGVAVMVLALNRTQDELVTARRRMFSNQIETANQIRKLSADRRQLCVQVLASSKASPGYVAMESIAWPTLDELLQERAQGRLPLAAAAQILRSILRALEALHSCGRVHGSVTPRNLLVELGEDRANVKLYGFEHSCPIDGSVAYAPVGAGAVASIDTPYVAPEIRDGQRGSVSSDVFSVGALLWRMLSGSDPPRVDDGSAAPLKLLMDEPGAVHLSPDVVSAIALALSLEPASRPKALAEIVGAIGRASSAAVSTATPTLLSTTSPTKTVVLTTNKDAPLPASRTSGTLDDIAARIRSIAKNLVVIADTEIPTDRPSSALRDGGRILTVIDRLDAAVASLRDDVRALGKPTSGEHSSGSAPSNIDNAAVQTPTAGKGKERSVPAGSPTSDEKAKERTKGSPTGRSAVPLQWGSARALAAVAGSMLIAFMAFAPKIESREVSEPDDAPPRIFREDSANLVGGSTALPVQGSRETGTPAQTKTAPALSTLPPLTSVPATSTPRPSATTTAAGAPQSSGPPPPSGGLPPPLPGIAKNAGPVSAPVAPPKPPPHRPVAPVQPPQGYGSDPY